MKTFTALMTTAALVVAAASATAQTSNDNNQPAQQDRIGSILGAIFGDRSNASSSIEAQWAQGRTPLATQRAQFDSRVDSDVRSGALDQRTATRIKTDYADLVQIELQYGADRRFTAQERNDLTNRYNALTQILANQGYGDEYDRQSITVAEGRADFIARVDASLAARRISRTVGNRLKTDYAMLVRTEANYMRDGRLSDQERDDLDARLDALDERVGDTGYSGNMSGQTARARLATIASAISTSGLTTALQAQMRTEQSDLAYLEAAYARLAMTDNDRAYMENRLSDMERRLRIRNR